MYRFRKPPQALRHVVPVVAELPANGYSVGHYELKSRDDKPDSSLGKTPVETDGQVGNKAFIVGDSRPGGAPNGPVFKFDRLYRGLFK
jgi:hypothetical protein